MIELFAKMIIGHCLADYPLQGDFLSKAKNHTAAIPGVPFYQALAAHSCIHAGAVWLVTGSAMLAAFELLAHAAIDYAKCAGRLSFNQDQFAHIACKAAWAVALPFVAF